MIEAVSLSAYSNNPINIGNCCSSSVDSLFIAFLERYPPSDLSEELRDLKSFDGYYSELNDSIYKAFLPVKSSPGEYLGLINLKLYQNILTVYFYMEERNAGEKHYRQWYITYTIRDLHGQILDEIKMLNGYDEDGDYGLQIDTENYISKKQIKHISYGPYEYGKEGLVNCKEELLNIENHRKFVSEEKTYQCFHPIPVDE